MYLKNLLFKRKMYGLVEQYENNYLFMYFYNLYVYVQKWNIKEKKTLT